MFYMIIYNFQILQKDICLSLDFTILRQSFLYTMHKIHKMHDEVNSIEERSSIKPMQKGVSYQTH